MRVTVAATSAAAVLAPVTAAATMAAAMARVVAATAGAVATAGAAATGAVAVAAEVVAEVAEVAVVVAENERTPPTTGAVGQYWPSSLVASIHLTSPVSVFSSCWGSGLRSMHTVPWRAAVLHS